MRVLGRVGGAAGRGAATPFQPPPFFFGAGPPRSAPTTNPPPLTPSPPPPSAPPPPPLPPLQGNASTLTRSEVRGGGKKPYAQKGTGNARIGSRRTPLKPGGGVVFGPKPVDWTIKMNKKERRLALATALASAAGDVVAVDALALPDAKTKTLVTRLAALGADTASQHVLIVADAVDDNLRLAARNVERLTVNKVTSLSARDVLKADRIVVDAASVAYINEFYGPKSA